MIEHIINKEKLSRHDIIKLLSAEEDDMLLLFKKSAQVKNDFVGRKVYLRGLIELSNIC